MLPPLPPSLLAMVDALQFMVASTVSKAVAVWKGEMKWLIHIPIYNIECMTSIAGV